MALCECSVIDRVEVLETGQVQVRRADRICRGEEVVATTFHRVVLQPGDSTDGLPAWVQAVAAAAWQYLEIEQ